MDPNCPPINEENFKSHDWIDFYGDVQEDILVNAPDTRGKEIVIRMKVGSDHAGDEVDRRSCTVFMIYVKMVLIAWLSNKKATAEKSVFGSEFVTMRHGFETLCGLRYKLHMMGVPINSPTYIFEDNMSVIFNTYRTEYQLGEKSNSICYHAVREAVAMVKCMTTHTPTLMSFADLLTKVLYGRKRRRLVNGIYFYIYEYN